ncbi:TonB-dependent receptor [Novosphingobium sp. PY1]|uniref:TonB-dependent receptor n=1 Tax=Novosphingobium sp. PY1 TaxID=1882221 RepID=UPI001A8CE995|nr:TonB-dependent receptor [Novosphingobium sp. PY1]GFM27295.1 TonB-dependent receptor [Novosphingobium sp. PY1]
MNVLHRSVSALAICTTMVLPQIAVAQESNAQAPLGGLEEIVVTAQRVSQSAQKAPLPVDVVTSADLRQQIVTRAEDLSRTSPALATVGGAGGTTTFYVRGVGNNTVNAYSDPAIAFNYDGVYIGRPSSTSGMFYDLARVEVLKGPQGTLYGRNATGGAINVIPNKPRLGEVGADATIGYGNYNWWTAQAAVNVPAGEAVAMRLAGTLSRHDAFMSDGTGNQREYGARFQIYAEPDPQLDLRIAADYAHQGGASSSSYYVGSVDPTFGPNGFAGYEYTRSGFSSLQGLGDPASQAYLASRYIPQVGRAGAVSDGTPSNDNDYWGVTAELNYKTDIGTLTIQPAWREAHIDYRFANIFREGGSKEDDRQASIEARWAGQAGPQIDYLLGGIYFDEKIGATAYYNQWTLSPFQQFDTHTKSWAGFGKVTFRPVERLSLTAAGRYTSDRKSFDGTSNVYILFCGNPALGNSCPTLPFMPLATSGAEVESFYGAAGIPVTSVPLFVLPDAIGGSQTAPFVLRSPIVINSSLKDNKFTYRLAAQYDFSPSNMVYASFETGYHAGGFSFARGLDSYEPETLDAYTLGSKNRFLGNRLQLNVEAFLWKYRNQQFSQFGYDLGDPPSTVLLTRNIGTSTIKGVDLDVEFQATPDTLLSGSVQYLDTKYDSFVYYAPNQGLPPKTACGYSPTTQTTPGGSVVNVFEIDCSGRQAFNAPRWSFTVNGEQTVPLGDLKLVLQAGTRYRSSTYFSADYLPFLKSKSNFVTTLSATLAEASDRWSITAYAFNVTDSRRLVNGVINSADLYVADAEQPRTYGLRASFHY